MKQVPKPLIWLFGLLMAVSAAGADELGAFGILSDARVGLGANDLSDLAWDGRYMWASGSGTVNQHVSNYGTVYDWRTFRQVSGFGQGTIFALAASGDTVVVSWGNYVDYNGQTVPEGDGLSISLNRGESWRHVPVTDFFPDRAEFKRPGMLTATWDIVIDRGVIWCSTLSGFLLKSADGGRTWTELLPSAPLNLLDLNHHGQCADAYGDTLWVGTFQGLNASFDKGKTWTNFSWPVGEPLSADNPKPGNFVYSVEHKAVGGKTHIWAGSDLYGNTGRYGICHSDDNGRTWTYKSTKYNAWNFAFGHKGASDPAVGDSTVFAASDSGLAVSYDLGENWSIMDIRESDQLAWKPGERIAGVTVVEDTLWVTSANGVARTSDWGGTWTIVKGLVRVPTLDEGKTDIGVSATLGGEETYAYPNPFSPLRRDADFSRTKIHYALTNAARVTVRIYDYKGKPVRDLVRGESRDGGREYDEIWNGRDENNSTCPNGVYFYIIKTDKGDTARGKIVVLD